MAVAYTTTKLLADIKRIAHIPTNQSTFEDSDLLALADHALQTGILPEMLSVRENYFLMYQDYQINDSGLFTIPDRAIGGKMADIQLIVGSNIAHLTHLELSQQLATIGSPTYNFGFILKGNQFEVLPAPTQGFVRVYFYARPGKLISTLAAGHVTAFDADLKTVTVSALPTTFLVNSEVDLVSNVSGFSTLQLENSIVSIAGTTVTLLNDLPSSLAVGDYLCMAGEAPIPQIPVEAQQVLVQATVVKIYEIQGYLDKMSKAGEVLEKLMKSLLNLISPRVSEAPKVIAPPLNDVMSNNLYGIGRNWGR